ncbi:hypothetical protein B0H13DRAFT_1910614 [Mycena leptocephala]|nr:hypothetical protein B0H13DRAFT_1910614 [Mycena leptocephala]
MKECVNSFRGDDVLDPDAEMESAPDPVVDIPPPDVDDSNEDEISLVFGPSGRIRPSANQISDYQNRGSLLEQLSVWDFAARIEKVSKVSFERNHHGAEEDASEEDSPASVDGDERPDVLVDASESDPCVAK